MTDRELLEMAAKAAGYLVQYEHVGVADGHFLVDEGIAWDPLHHDGDALRLAVKLCIVVVRYPVDRIVSANNEELAYDDSKFGGDCDPYAATRRAIVHAAAAMCRVMP